MAAIRRSRDITLEHIAETTKITKRFLQAIEDSEFDKLPGGIFNISYIRQYARAIDFDEESLLEYYNSCTQTTEGGGNGSPEPGKKPASRVSGLLALARF